MIWNEKVLFIHAPKTAGMSMSRLLIGGLEGNVCATEPVEEGMDGRGVTVVPGKRHATLKDAGEFLGDVGKALRDFERIFVVMRNPYDLEVSRYFYLRKGHEVDRGPAQKVAMEESFGGYLEKAPFFGRFPPRLDEYYHLESRIPENLVILRFEFLDDQLDFFVRPYVRDMKIPHINQSERKDYQWYYDDELEQACYLRHRWFFDKGFYPRQRF